MSETMTDEVTSDTGEDKPARRGRPRQQHTIEQDDQVYEFLASTGATGATKEQVAEALRIPENKVYLSFYRLRVADRIVRQRRGDRGHVWFATVNAPPEDAPDVATASAPQDLPEEQTQSEPPPLF